MQRKIGVTGGSGICRIGGLAPGDMVALDHAVMTAPELRDPARLARLDAVAGRVLR